MGSSKAFCVKMSNNGKIPGAKEPFCSVVILVIVKFSFYRIRDKIHLHGNNILKHTCEAEKYVCLCRASYPKSPHSIRIEEGVKRAKFYHFTGLDWNSGLPRIK